MQPITITDTAKEKVISLISEEQQSDDELLFLRMGIVGGGCSGFTYDFEFAEESDKEDDDIIIECTLGQSSAQVIVDSISFQYLKGATLDYVCDLKGDRFVITNPHAKSTCGCGSSFSIDN